MADSTNLIKQIDVDGTIYDVYDRDAVHQSDELITTADIDTICGTTIQSVNLESDEVKF